MPQATVLRQWYAARGAGQMAVSLSTPVTSSDADPLKRKTLSSITVRAVRWSEA